MQKTEIANRPEVAEAVVSQHQRHAIHDECFDDASHQSLAETNDVEVGVQIAGKSHQRTAIVVPIAIKNAIERVLHGLAYWLRQKHNDDGGEQSDDPRMRV